MLAGESKGGEGALREHQQLLKRHFDLFLSYQFNSICCQEMHRWRVGGRLCTSSLLSGALQLQEVVIPVNKRVNFKHILTKSNCSGKYHITGVQTDSQLGTLVSIEAPNSDFSAFSEEFSGSERAPQTHCYVGIGDF